MDSRGKLAMRRAISRLEAFEAYEKRHESYLASNGLSSSIKLLKFVILLRRQWSVTNDVLTK